MSTRTREESTATGDELKASGLKLDPETTKAALTARLKGAIAVEPDVTKYDTVVGDGDCGIGLKRGAEGAKDDNQILRFVKTEAKLWSLGSPPAQCLWLTWPTHDSQIHYGIRNST